MSDDLEPSATCTVLLELEGNGEQPRPSQLAPAEAQSSVKRQKTQEVMATPQNSHPPPKKRARTVAKCQVQEDSALLRIVEESTKQMGSVCMRQHIDFTNPTMAFTIHLCHELQAVPPNLRSDAKLELHRVVHQFQKEGQALHSDE